MKAGWCVFAVLCVAGASICAAAEINVDVGDEKPVIRGRIGNDASFTVAVGLTAKNGPAELVFRALDLRTENDAVFIGRSQVTLANGDKVTLQEGIPKDLKIAVAGVKVPGTYKGKIEFWQADGEVRRFDLTVVAVAPPKLVPRKGTDDIKLQVVRCARDCWLARWLLPGGSFLTEYPLMFDNQSLGPATVDAISVGAFSADNRYPLTAKELELSLPAPFLPQPIATLPLKIHADRIPAGHYVGDIQLKLADQDERMKLPLDISVRTGPGWASVLLVIGILLGRLAKHFKDSGEAHADFPRKLADNQDYERREGAGRGENLKWLKWRQRVRSGFALVAGLSDDVQLDKPKSVVARAILYFLLIGCLVLVGLEQFYIKNLAFGANPFTDYTGILFWAVSTDVASRTLSNIRGS